MMPRLDYEADLPEPGGIDDQSDSGGFEGREPGEHVDHDGGESEPQREPDPIDSDDGREQRATGLDEGGLRDNATGDVCDEMSDRYNGFDDRLEISLLGGRREVEYHLLDTRLDGSTWDSPEPGERTTSWLDLDLDLTVGRSSPDIGAGHVFDAARGAVDFLANYVGMRIANTKGADKYFHCMANCEASSRGPGGESAAQAISDAREQSDFARNVSKLGFEEALRDCRADNFANRVGREAGRSGERCYDACGRFRPRGLD